MDAGGGMLPDPLRDVDQIIAGVDLMQPAGNDGARHDRDVSRAERGAAIIPMFLQLIGIVRRARSRW